MIEEMYLVTVDRRQKHDIGYWASIAGFATVIVSGLFGSFLSIDTEVIISVAAAGFLVFLVGAELALRHGKHADHSEW